MNFIRKFLRFLYFLFTGRWPELRDFFKSPKIERYQNNPTLSPTLNKWESRGVLNPAAILIDGKVYLLYRAIGEDGVSRIGFASSTDGLHFDERLNYPVFALSDPSRGCLPGKAYRFDPILYPSGGSWGGCEDPRMVNIEGKIYLTFNALYGWDMRIEGVTIDKDDFINKEWNWSYPFLISPERRRNKNWILFPEKINGKFAVLHSIIGDDDNSVRIEYTDDIKTFHKRIFPSPDPQRAPDQKISWHHRMRSASAPPLRTDSGWLVFYQAMQEGEPDRYKVGVMLLDLDNPEKVINRSKLPVLEPDMFYENDWKPGIVYVCGTLVKDGTLLVYYGGGDKYVCVASAPLDQFLSDIKHNDKPHVYFRKILFG